MDNPSGIQSTYNQRSSDKMKADEGLGPGATISAVLYANMNHPEWKTEFKSWSDRYKQIIKKWRTLSNEQKAPYLQKAKDNRSALRMKKQQQVNMFVLAKVKLTIYNYKSNTGSIFIFMVIKETMLNMLGLLLRKYAKKMRKVRKLCTKSCEKKGGVKIFFSSIIQVLTPLPNGVFSTLITFNDSIFLYLLTSSWYI